MNKKIILSIVAVLILVPSLPLHAMRMPPTTRGIAALELQELRKQFDDALNNQSWTRAQALVDQVRSRGQAVYADRWQAQLNEAQALINIVETEEKRRAAEEQRKIEEAKAQSAIRIAKQKMDEAKRAEEQRKLALQLAAEERLKGEEAKRKLEEEQRKQKAERERQAKERAERERLEQERRRKEEEELKRKKAAGADITADLLRQIEQLHVQINKLRGELEASNQRFEILNSLDQAARYEELRDQLQIRDREIDLLKRQAVAAIPSLTPAASKEITDLNKQVESLRNELNKWKQDSATREDDLRKQLREADDRYKKELEAERKRSENDRKAAREASEKLEQKLQKEMDQYKDIANRRGDVATINERLKKQLEEARSDYEAKLNRADKAHQADLTAAYADNERLEKEKIDQRKEIERLRAGGKVSEGVVQENKKLKEDNEQLKKLYEGAGTERNRLRQLVEEKDRRIDNLTPENKKLQDENAKLLKVNTDLSKEIDNVKRDWESATNQLAARGTQIGQLSRENTQLQGDIAKIRADVKKELNDERNRHAQDMNKYRIDLEGHMRRANETHKKETEQLTQERDEAVTNIAKAREENNALAEEIERLKKQLADAGIFI